MPLAAFGLTLLLIACAPATTTAQADTLTIVSGDERHVFEVELAVTDSERAKGLMFRRSLDDDAGMLFDFGAERPVGMWMRNTFIPLDMIFAHQDGTIYRIEQRTEPHSERTISSGAGVRFVLEIKGGVADRLGIEAGDRLVHTLIPSG